MPIPVFSPTVSRLLPLAAVLLLACAIPAAAQEADEPTGLQQILGKMGILDIPDGPPIDYRERAPLVVPPSTELIPPGGLSGRDDMKRINPDWPTDVDIKRHHPTAAAKKKALEDEKLFYSGRPLTPEEMRRGTISKKEAERQPSGVSAGEELARGKERQTPDQLGFKGWFSKEPEQATVFTGEPERSNLTQPPPGYRTPSPNAPYGVVARPQEDNKPSTLYERTQSAGDKR